MVTVTVKHSYPDATRYGTAEDGTLRIYCGDEVIAQYAAGIEHEVGYEPGAPLEPVPA